MGICPIFHSSSQNKIQLNKGEKHTDRPLDRVQFQYGLQTQNQGNKHINHDVPSNNEKAQYTSKHPSTGIGLSQCEKKSSFMSQLNTFDSSSILMKNPKEKLNEDRMYDDYYILIDKVLFIRKTMDKIKISIPYKEGELNCSYKSLLSTVFLAQGMPLESLKEVTMGKIIQVKNSPISIKLKLQCRQCQRKIKLSFAKSLIDLSLIHCDKCNSTQKWALNDIESNYPVWGDARKIQNNQILNIAPTLLRVLGCIYCMRYTNCEELPCGCLACKTCLQQNVLKQCHICEAVG